MPSNNRDMAEAFLVQSRNSDTWSEMSAHCSTAIAHALLALLDYLQQDEGEREIQHNAYLTDRRIRQLEADLEAARKALRDREQVTATEMDNTPWSVE